MPVRYPPTDKTESAVGHGRVSGRNRIVAYRDPGVGFWRRVARMVFSAPVLIPLGILGLIVVVVLVYYWTVFSGRIDNLLRGEVFTRSAGIYAAPKQIRVGEATSQEELIAYLKRAGYVEKNQQADTARGRYSINGATLDVEPSQNSTVDGQAQFQSVRVQFSRNAKSIAALASLSGNAAQERVWLEPELISSVTGQERSKRKVIGFNDLPPHLVKAITVTEDRSFFEHYGVNFRGILRALVRRYDNSDPNSPIARQGGSSITQQLVKNLLLSPERTPRRKVAEAYMSIILETRLTKEQIFALYCNQAYLGQQAGFSIHGFGQAADAYFNKDVTNLTLPEAAFLAGLIRSPNRYNPYHDINTATARRNQVFDSMVEAGELKRDEADGAKAEPLKVAPVKGRIDVSDAPYFADYVQNQLGDIIAGAGAEHLRIYTTVDMDLQRAAYASLTRQLNALDKIQAKRFAAGTLQAALVAMNAKTGEIVAMVGGRDYSKSQLNRASDAFRQPGSVFKPFVYATALNTAYDPVPRVITPATTYLDEPKTFTYDNQEYSPGNFGDTYSRNPVTLRDALVNSLNVITVDVAMEVTIGRVMSLAAKAGLPKPARAYPAMALGTSEATPLQVASAYTSFATLGTRTSSIAINRITTGNGVTLAAPTPQRSEVMRPDVAYVMTSFMKDVVNRGTAAKVRARGLKANVAGKTGTSRDGWFAGYTPNLVCVVWVGFDDGSQLGLTGANSALPIWTDFMQVALTEHPEWQGDWAMPEGVQQAEIDPKTGELAPPDAESRRTELFINGTSPAMASEEEPEAEVTPEGEVQPSPEPGAETVATPDPSPSPTPRTRPTPRLADESVLEGTITLDIDPTTGLLAVETCPIIRTKTFVIGSEPRKYCGPEHHRGKTVDPSASRPRVVATPPQR
jgi:penicillin-binding protein 1B